MGNRAPVHGTIHNCSIYFQGVSPNNSARLPNRVQFRPMTEPQVDEHAKCAAEYCWLTVRKDLSRDTLLKEDLAALLPGPEETQFAFGLFDWDNDGYVTEPEVHARFQSMYRWAFSSGDWHVA